MSPQPHRDRKGRRCREAHGDVAIGAIVRIARQTQGLTLAALGQKTGYSASQVSRFERGEAALRLETLRRFADVLGIPPQAVGLVPITAHHKARHAAPFPARGAAYGPTVVGEHGEDGEGPVRRRELLTGAAGLAATGALGLPVRLPDGHGNDAASGFENLLYGRPGTAGPLSVSELRAATMRARQSFQTARYDRLAVELPDLVATAVATTEQATGDARPVASALLSDAYTVAANFMVKLNDDQLAWALADRAVQAADASGDVLALADARRGLATVMRRLDRPERARALLIDAAEELRPGQGATGEQVAMYGTLLQVAAYTAAVGGDRSGANDLIVEAGAAAARLGRDTNDRHLAFGPTNVTLYRISIAQVLGDNGAAIAHAKALRPAAIPTRERQGRYWVDVARAWHQWGKPEACYRALLAAERAAPAEVRYRPPVHRMTAALLRAERRGSLPGLRAFAARVGVAG